MTVWIKPESDREGGAVCQFWLQGGNETPTDRTESFMAMESPWGPWGHHPPFLKE